MTRQAEYKLQFRVYKTNGTRCIRKFDSLEAAKSWCFTCNSPDSHRIEWRYENETEPRRMYL